MKGLMQLFSISAQEIQENTQNTQQKLEEIGLQQLASSYLDGNHNCTYFPSSTSTRIQEKISSFQHSSLGRIECPSSGMGHLSILRMITGWNPYLKTNSAHPDTTNLISGEVLHICKFKLYTDIAGGRVMWFGLQQANTVAKALGLHHKINNKRNGQQMSSVIILLHFHVIFEPAYRIFAWPQHKASQLNISKC